MKKSNIQHLFTHLVLSFVIFSAISGIQHKTEAKGSLPDNWWEQSLAKPIHSSQEYFDLLGGEGKNKFVFIDFYMEYCSWCYYILADFNQLIEDMNEWYGEEKVEFIKVDGNKIKKLQELYKVPSYPYFVAVVPGTNGKTYSAFKYQPRNYDTLKKWMLEVMATTPMKDQTPSSVVAEESTYKQVTVPQMQQQMPQATAQAQKQVHTSMISNAIKDIGSQQNTQNKKMEELIQLLESALKDDPSMGGQQQPEQQKTEQAGVQLSPATYILLGLIGGTLASVTLIAYVSRQNVKQRKAKMRREPSSGSPLTRSLDEEKSA
ncbi:protein disulfide [Stylonychia lemnae]|uniref:Protein disulfide n=1 Tax=Stylonychia lemnae TaxID=5949 RepID=A0A078AA16_STYLE|nr:protein disulfide [Stylonychia lemnae]|eukprot:CDW79110.1 protein disulfide [Stylonychia lemnae]